MEGTCSGEHGIGRQTAQPRAGGGRRWRSRASTARIPSGKILHLRHACRGGARA
jgi:hypothetical protein